MERFTLGRPPESERLETGQDRTKGGPSTALGVKVRGVDMTYRSGAQSIHALSDIDLHVAAGEFVSVVGPSGCGKSTMLKIIAGLVTPTAGAVKVDDRVVKRPITNVGIVFQNPVLLEWRRALSNVMLQIELRGLDRTSYRRRAEELLVSVGLEGFEQRYPYELSGGMQQRVALCRALVHDPPLLLMDEPYGALDALTREQLANDLQRLWLTTQKTVLFVTHSVSEAVFLSDRIVVLSARPGRVVGSVQVDLPRPRALAAREDPEFGRVSHEVYALLTSGGARYVPAAVDGSMAEDSA